MEHPILITWLNDFVFCPRSIFFHNLYGGIDRISYQSPSQINGTKAHESIDRGAYSTRKDIISGMAVFSEKYGLTGKIDLYDAKTKTLIERKKKIKVIYDGYVYQLYGQYFSMKEMGYEVKRLVLRSLDDNRKYEVPLPEADPEMMAKFEAVISEMAGIDISKYKATTPEKCRNCIYEPLCDSSLME